MPTISFKSAYRLDSLAYLRPHLCSNDTDILMPNLDGRRDQLGINNVFPE
jgi:hypothetical protein